MIPTVEVREGMLILLPNLLEPQGAKERWFAPAVTAAMERISGLFAESEREGRRYLRYFFDSRKAAALPIAPLLTKYDRDELDFYLKPILEGQIWGVVSDCGSSAIADPGQAIVRAARLRNIPIELHSSPSAPLFALALAAFPTNRFSFEGYLPIEESARVERILALEKRSLEERMAMLFIEAPHRSEALFQSFLKTLHGETELALFWEMCGDGEGSVIDKVSRLRHLPPPALHKKRVVFLFFAAMARAPKLAKGTFRR